MKLQRALVASLLVAICSTLIVSSPSYASEPVPFTESDCTDVTVLAFRGSSGSRGLSESSANNNIVTPDFDADNDGVLDSVRYEDHLEETKNPYVVSNGWESKTIHRLLEPAIAQASADGTSVSVVGMGPDQGYDRQKEFFTAVNYLQSTFVQGTRIAMNAVNYMNVKKTSCPNTKFYLVGYSLGAIAVHEIVALAPNMIFGTYTIGDPMQFPAGTQSNVYGNPSAVGVFPLVWGVANPISSGLVLGQLSEYHQLNPKRSLCHPGDSLCSSSFTTVISKPSPSHSNYFRNGVDLENDYIADGEIDTFNSLTDSQKAEMIAADNEKHDEGAALAEYWANAPAPIDVSMPLSSGMVISGVPTNFNVSGGIRSGDATNSKYTYTLLRQLFPNVNIFDPVATFRTSAFSYQFPPEFANTNVSVFVEVKDAKSGKLITKYALTNTKMAPSSLLDTPPSMIENFG